MPSGPSGVNVTRTVRLPANRDAGGSGTSPT